jgi:hypothetical protein
VETSVTEWSRRACTTRAQSSSCSREALHRGGPRFRCMRRGTERCCRRICRRFGRCNGCENAAPIPPTECLPGGLADLDVNGSWMLTGTMERGRGPEPYTASVTFCRSGDGWCQCNDTSGASYADDTWLYTGVHAPRQGSTRYTCVRATDRTLGYREYRYNMFPGIQSQTFIDGVLTRCAERRRFWLASPGSSLSAFVTSKGSCFGGQSQLAVPT